ncbi:acyl-CoA thioesterase [Sphingorhabdus sp. M41]|uniref:acyl-CoA thioesterase n=1 Tax=Sphingorhabdus sp. M41 TaxID=1806885 RepID=UPI00078C84C4|nr:acyl-CoA thioesterase [Sphingorhabdus sp. M41]AMO71119.1 acyl-CoA thioesterase [Sphingorhabdus sp. M41]
MSNDELKELTKVQPVLRVAPQPRDLNNNGHIFGGWVLSQMDIAGGIMAARVARGSTATVAIEAMEFIAPILSRDLISVYARVERIGRTSIAIRLNVIASRNLDEEQVPVTSGLFTFVALDENHHPRVIPEESKKKYLG